MATARLTLTHLTWLAVGLTVAGMLAGTTLLFVTSYREVGWLLFILSFGGWLGAALLALREGWHAGWFDR